MIRTSLLLAAAATMFAASPALARKAAEPAPNAAPKAADGPAEADWRTPDPAQVMVIDTSKGRIFVELDPVSAPQAAARIRDLTRSGLYDGRAFFRVIDDFMDQTGDPQDTGMGGSTLPNLPPEFQFRRGSDLPFAQVTKAGTLDAGYVRTMPVISQPMGLGALTADGKVNAYVSFCAGVGGVARADDPASGNSQFFLMRGANAQLDLKYAAFGRVIAGMDVVKAIKVGEPPVPPADKMLKVRMLADIPAAERPTVRVVDTGGAWFRAQAEKLRAEKLIDFPVCDIEIPSQVKQP